MPVSAGSGPYSLLERRSRLPTNQERKCAFNTLLHAAGAVHDDPAGRQYRGAGSQPCFPHEILAPKVRPAVSDSTALLNQADRDFATFKLAEGWSLWQPPCLLMYTFSLVDHCVYMLFGLPVSVSDLSRHGGLPSLGRAPCRQALLPSAPRHGTAKWLHADPRAAIHAGSSPGISSCSATGVWRPQSQCLCV